MAYIDDYKLYLNSLIVNETINLECSDGITREFKSSIISGSTQLHNSNGIIANINDFKDWNQINEVLSILG